MGGRLANIASYFDHMVEIRRRIRKVETATCLYACTVSWPLFPSWFIKQTHTLLGLLHFTSLLTFHFLSHYNVSQHSCWRFFLVIHLEHLESHLFLI
jgi:hypothetical protein